MAWEDVPLIPDTETEAGLLLGGDRDAPINRPRTALENNLFNLLSRNWTTRVADASFAGTFESMASGAGLLVAVGNDECQSSEDGGFSWVHRNALGGMQTPNIAADLSTGRWVAAGDSVGGGLILSAEDNALSWSTVESGGAAFNGVAASGAGSWCAVGDGGRIMTSVDGLTWQPRTAGGGFSGVFHDVAYGNGRWVAVGEAGTVQMSVDGVTWVPQTAGSVDYRAVVYSDEQWVIAGTFGRIDSSVDGATWVERSAGLPSYTYGALAAAGRWVLAAAVSGSSAGALMLSSDGLTWSQVRGNGPAGLHRCVWTGGGWAACGNGGHLETSLFV